MPNFALPSDKSLGLLRVEGAQKTVAIVVQYNVQSNIMAGCSNTISGDLAGQIVDCLERRLGCICLYISNAPDILQPFITSNIHTLAYDNGRLPQLEATTLSFETAAMLMDYAASVQLLDILDLFEKQTRFSSMLDTAILTKGVHT